MKTTPFTDKHIALGAKMHEFAGYNMPIEYSGITDEHMTVRNGVGVFDVSHMGEFWVKGPKALAFLQKVTSNDVSVLPDWQSSIYLFSKRKRRNCGRFIGSPLRKNKYLLSCQCFKY
jgi:aminomethyltransferase